MIYSVCHPGTRFQYEIGEILLVQRLKRIACEINKSSQNHSNIQFSA